MAEEMILNGRFVEAGGAALSPNDRGFQFSESIYDVIRSYNGKPFAVDRHLLRIKSSLEAIGLQFEAVSDFIEMAMTLPKRNGRPDSLIYLQVTPGSVPRAHLRPAGLTPTTVAMSMPVPSAPVDWASKGGLSVITVPDQRWAMCHIKTTMLLCNTMAKSQAVAAGCDDAIFVRDGFVTEVTSSNVFLVFDGVLWTPPKSNYILHGITRSVVLDCAAELGIPVSEAPIAASRLGQAQEAFITGTVQELAPVASIDGRQVGDGALGPIWKRLLARYQQKTQS